MLGTSEAPLTWEEEEQLYRGLITRLENAEGPDEAIDRDLSRLLREAATCAFTSDLPAIMKRLRRTFPNGGCDVSKEPEIDALIWEDGPTRAESEFFSSAWRNDLGGAYMPRPPASVPMACSLAFLRSMAALFGD